MAQATRPRPVGPGRTPPPRRARRGPRSTFASMATLARWQLRPTGRLLVLIGLGLLTAVVLVCAIPLYVQVSLSAGIRHTLEANPQNLVLTVHADSHLFDTGRTSGVQSQVDSLVQENLGTNALLPPTFSIQFGSIPYSRTAAFRIVGTDMGRAAPHVKLLKGRLPASTSKNTIEMATTAADQSLLGLPLGKTVSFTFPVDASQLHPPSPPPILHFQLVGLIAPPDPTDTFWHGEDLTSNIMASGLSLLKTVPMLASNAEIMNMLEAITVQLPQNASYGIRVDLYWYYPFNLSQFDINGLADLTTSLNATLTAISNNPIDEPFVNGTTASGPLNVLQDYSNRITVLQLPISCLAYLIAGLVLFFVLLLIEVLVERQFEAIALLRSRGASRRQIFGALLGQSLGPGIVAFIAGPLLAILGVVLLASFTLVAENQGALNVITARPLQVAQSQLQRDLIVVGIAVLGASLAIWRVLRSNVLVMRQERARSTQRPLWMRWRLDLLAAMAALAGFGFSLYIQSPGVLDVRTRTLILPVTSLVGVLFLLLGGLLLLLRGLPALLRWSERLAARTRGAAPVLAMAQIARAPRQPLRTTLLFALAVAFALFAVIFSQTQTQRIDDMTLFQVGADFSGSIPDPLQGEDLNSQIEFYRSIKGVTSVTLGTSTFMGGGSDRSIPILLEAVDSHSYASTFQWPAQNSAQPESALLATLYRQQATAVRKNVVPAILDDAAAQALGIGQGQQFVLANFNGPLNFVAVGIVHALPTIYDSTTSTGSDTSVPRGGVLADFQTYSQVETNANQPGIETTQVWVRANPADLANVRSVLFRGTYALGAGLDRQALAQNLATDPLYRAIVGVLALGAIIALLLGLMGNLLVAWWNARSRHVSFALLRALGCAPGQVASVLLWEQGIVYSVGLVLGVVLGLVFALAILPAFIFSPVTSVGSIETFYVAQSLPPVRVAIPVLSLLVLFAGLVVVCILALLLMLRIIVRPQIGQALRLDED
jgi:hypothetical protein